MVGSKIVGYTTQCPHCGMHFEERPGSGIKRGRCSCSPDTVCGKKLCLATCVSKEHRLRIMEVDDSPELAISRERLTAASNMLELCRGDKGFHEYNEEGIIDR